MSVVIQVQHLAEIGIQLVALVALAVLEARIAASAIVFNSLLAVVIA